MTGVALLSLAVVAGGPARPLLLTAAAYFAPWPTVAVMAGLVLGPGRRRVREIDARVAVLSALSAELRSGRSLRAALHSACGQSSGFARVGRRARLGLPIEAVVSDLADGFGVHGTLVAASLRLAERGGGSVVAALETVGTLLRDDLELEAEVRAGAAPARASVVAVVVAPLLFVGLQTVDGSIGTAMGTPGGRLLATAGVALVGLGVAVSLLLARRIR